MRLMVYTHDTFGLGNIRRMLAVCEYLLAELPDLSILLVSGSPMLHSFRLAEGLDYIKIPCLNRGNEGELAAKYLGTETKEILKLRADLILSTAVNFKPDLLLVDKKPYGLKNELTSTVEYLKTELPKTKLVLLLRDILDRPEKTIQEWRSHAFYQAIQAFYDLVLVVGTPKVFDLTKEYQFPESVAQKVRFCGYIRKQPGQRDPSILRQELQVLPEERLILVTPGGDEDGYRLIDTYLSGLALLPKQHNLKSLIICGPEMPIAQTELLYHKATEYPQVQMEEFTDDLMSYIAAADAVVSMGGYNTVCEILSSVTPAVVVPRIKPSQEQWIRAERMARLGLFKAIHPEQLTPDSLMQALVSQLSKSVVYSNPVYHLDFDALEHIANHISTLLFGAVCKSKVTYPYQKLGQFICLATIAQR